MTATRPIARVLAATFLAGTLMALAATPGLGQDPASDKDKQIADLEKQLTELQSKLKALKEPSAPRRCLPARKSSRPPG